MIAGVELRDVLMRRDDRGHVAELFSENFGDSIVHLYRCAVRENIAKGFHAHVGVYDQDTHEWGEGQTDRFTPIRGSVKVGLIDIRGPIASKIAADSVFLDDEKVVEDWVYHGILGDAGEPLRFQSIWPDDAAWTSLVGTSPTFLEQQTIVLHADDPQVLFIPPGVAHGIYCLSGHEAEILNAPTVAYHRPSDELRMPPDTLGFAWTPRSR